MPFRRPIKPKMHRDTARCIFTFQADIPERARPIFIARGRLLIYNICNAVRHTAHTASTRRGVRRLQEKGVTGLTYSIFWLAVFLITVVIEAITVGLASIWFAVGALASLIAALCGAPLWLQIALFVVVSIAALIFMRPLAKKYVDLRRTPTNADRLLGMTGIVSEQIDNIRGTGAVTIDGKTWSARSLSGSAISAGALVKPVKIDGVKLIVEEAAVTAEK